MGASRSAKATYGGGVVDRQRASALSAIVVGGGIAGLATATGLLHAGWRVKVIERESAVSELGAGLAITKNGMAAVDALGLGEILRKQGVPIVVTGQQDHRGRWIMRQPRDDRRFLDTNRALGVHRKRLVAVLEAGARATAGGAEMVLGATVFDVQAGDPADGPALVRWVDRGGAESEAEADLVVVADGVRSQVRDLLVPDVDVVYSGKTCWRAVIEDTHLVDDDFVMVWGPHTEFGAVRISPTEVYWYGYFLATANTAFPDELTAAQSHFAHWQPRVRAIVASTAPDQLLRHDVVHLPRGAPRYVAGRAVLVGDAAHALVPTMGQGANLCLEDAASVGRMISEPVHAGQPLDRALARYDAVRRPRGRAIARRSVMTGRMGADLGPGWPQHLRNAALRLIPTTATVRAGSRILNWTPTEGASPR